MDGAIVVPSAIALGLFLALYMELFTGPKCTERGKVVGKFRQRIQSMRWENYEGWGPATPLMIVSGWDMPMVSVEIGGSVVPLQISEEGYEVTPVGAFITVRYQKTRFIGLTIFHEVVTREAS